MFEERSGDKHQLSPPLRLLVCLARSPQARALAGEGAAIARLIGAELKCVHVRDTPSAATDDLVRTLEDAGVDPANVSIAIRDGRPADAICEVARTEQIDLIVAGALEREGLLASMMMGSIARRVARNAPCSVLLLAKGQSPATDGFAQIVAATQLNEYSFEMLGIIAREARRAGTRALHVVRELGNYEMRELRYRNASSQESRDFERSWLLEHQEQLIQFLEPLDFANLELHVRCLTTGEGVAAMEYAERCNADLLVYPAPPRRMTLWDQFFDHPSSVVLQQIKCALLVYRTPVHRVRRRGAP